MTKTTKILSKEDIIDRLDSFIENDGIGTIFPAEFFTSIKYFLTTANDGTRVSMDLIDRYNLACKKIDQLKKEMVELRKVNEQCGVAP